MLEELFGTPHHKVVMGAVISRKPKSTIPPEPMLSRASAPLKLELVLEPKASTWTLHPWQKYSTVIYNKSPEWTIIVFGREASTEDMSGNSSSPWDTVIQARKDQETPLHSLPSFMKVMHQGSTEENESSSHASYKTLS